MFPPGKLALRVVAVRILTRNKPSGCQKAVGCFRRPMLDHSGCEMIHNDVRSVCMAYVVCAGRTSATDDGGGFMPAAPPSVNVVFLLRCVCLVRKHARLACRKNLQPGVKVHLRVHKLVYNSSVTKFRLLFRMSTGTTSALYAGALCVFRHVATLFPPHRERLLPR